MGKMTTLMSVVGFSRSIEASPDDGYAHQITGTDFEDGTGAVLQLVAGDSASNVYGMWLRFPTWPSMVGKTVNTAQLILVMKGGDSGSGTVKLKITGHDSATPNAPTTAAIYRTKSPTTAAIDWDDIPFVADGTVITSPELKTIIQELIDTYTVTVIQLLVKDDGSATSKNLQVNSFDDDPALAPRLELTFV